MKHKLIIAGFVLLFLVCFTILWWIQGVKPADPTNEKLIAVTIQRNESIRTIAEKLQSSGVIRSSVAFFLLSRFGGFADKIQAGEFLLSPTMDLYTITQTLTHGTLDSRITIPEGLRKEEIAMIVAQNFSVPESEFIKRTKEGYLFPDTYLIPNDASLDTILGTFSLNFEKKVTPEMRLMAQKRGLSLDDVIIIASLIEREAKFAQDRNVVASIILNRVREGMKLDIDATIQYALGYQPKEKTWWKKELTLEDLAIDSPYNTYVTAGLPPTAISNPGLAAITAVVDAADSAYLFYISDKEGNIHPAKTIEEHNANITTYLNR